MDIMKSQLYHTAGLWTGLEPKMITSIFIRIWRFGCKDRRMGQEPCTKRSRAMNDTSERQGVSRIPDGHQDLRKGKAESSSLAFRNGLVLWTLRFQSCRIQNFQKIDFYSLTVFVCDPLLWRPRK